jgi:hypothetical protein
MEFDEHCGECEWCKMHDLEVPILEDAEADVE